MFGLIKMKIKNNFDKNFYITLFYPLFYQQSLFILLLFQNQKRIARRGQNGVKNAKSV